jgi:WD40-like Beta Propeller Repeat
MSEKQGPRTRSEKLRSEETQSCAPELIEEQLSRILVSREFSRSDRMARFLRHIVKAQIEGRTDDLKERSIGIDVFDRSIDWDPKIDNIVRSEARRLRNKLEQYYASSRSDDCVRISMPKGAYAPDFAYLKRAVPSVMTEPAELPTIPPASGSQFARPSSYYFALLFALVAVATFSIGIFRSMGSRETTVHAALADISPLANEIGAEISPAISSDGKWIAYAWDGNGGSYDIYMKPSNGGPDVPPKRLTQGPGMNLYPAWSPDGRTLAFVRIERNGASFLTKDLNAGNEKVLVRVRQRPSGWVAENAPYMDVGPSWLPDGRSLLYSDGAADDGNHGIYRVSLDEPEPKAIVTTEREVVDYFPRVSPNGRELAFVRYISHGVSDLYICSIDGSGLRRLTSDRRGIGGLAWAVDGRSLFYTAWSQGRREYGRSEHPRFLSRAVARFGGRDGYRSRSRRRLDGLRIGVRELEHLADVSSRVIGWRHTRASGAAHCIFWPESRSFLLPRWETSGVYFRSHGSLAGLARRPERRASAPIDKVRRELSRLDQLDAKFENDCVRCPAVGQFQYLCARCEPGWNPCSPRCHSIRGASAFLVGGRHGDLFQFESGRRCGNLAEIPGRWFGSEGGSGRLLQICRVGVGQDTLFQRDRWAVVPCWTRRIVALAASRSDFGTRNQLGRR